MTALALPPDRPLLELATLINKRLPPGMQVNFYRIKNDDEFHATTAIIYQAASQRTTVKTREMLTKHNADEIVRSITDWAARIQMAQRWTTDLSEAS